MFIESHLEDLASHERLQQQLTASLAKARSESRASAALLYRGEVRTATHPVAAHEDPFPAHVGCQSKFLTATLVAHAVANGQLSFDDDVFALLARSMRRLDVAKLRDRRITVRHLLNHTHGLDASAIGALRYSEDGFIDSDELADSLLSTPALFEPGEMFSYSNAGPWLAASALETAHEKPYARILEDELLAKLDANDRPAPECVATNVCPAIGNRLRLTARALARIAALHLPSARANAAMQVLREQLIDPAVWQPRVRKVGLGLNSFGDGWYGHNSKFAGDSICLRFAPHLDCAIVTTADASHSAQNILAELVEHRLQEFSQADIPKTLSSSDWMKVDTAPYLGTFRCAAMSAEIKLAANGSLKIGVYLERDAAAQREPAIRRYLKPAARGVFFSSPPDPEVIPFVQFLQFDGRLGKFCGLFADRQLLVRTE